MHGFQVYNIIYKGGFMKKINHRAFTLAEVLITLGIIGIVAAMTLPALISDHKAKVIANKLKKVQSTFAQALLMAENEYGPLDSWGLAKDTEESAQMLGKRIAPYLKLIDNCGIQACESYTGEWHFLKGNQDPDIASFHKDNFYKLRLADGSELFIRPDDGHFGLFIDINGKKTPNIMGKDIFRLVGYTNGKVIPTEVGEDPKTQGWPYCNPTTGEGWACAAWIMYKENMDYLKCADKLEWNGRTKCN